MNEVTYPEPYKVMSGFYRIDDIIHDIVYEIEAQHTGKWELHIFDAGKKEIWKALYETYQSALTHANIDMTLHYA